MHTYFQKAGDPPKPDKEIKGQSKLTKEEWKEFFSGHWNFGGARQDGHIAMFPEELPRRLIKMFAFVNDIVLAPFMGSGTTNLTAKNLGRNSVGYEINSEYIEFANNKLAVDQPDMIGTRYEFLEDQLQGDVFERIEELPYRFIDYHKFDKKKRS
jgi:site-specific DNA-methyltransferase (adenine-specific)